MSLAPLTDPALPVWLLLLIGLVAGALFIASDWLMGRSRRKKKP